MKMFWSKQLGSAQLIELAIKMFVIVFANILAIHNTKYRILIDLNGSLPSLDSISQTNRWVDVPTVVENTLVVFQELPLVLYSVVALGSYEQAQANSPCINYSCTLYKLCAFPVSHIPIPSEAYPHSQ